MIFLPTFWQRWGTTAKSVLDTAVTNIGYSSKKCRIKSDFIDRVIATSRCHFTSFSSFLNDFLNRFFVFSDFFLFVYVFVLLRCCCLLSCWQMEYRVIRCDFKIVAKFMYRWFILRKWRPFWFTFALRLKSLHLS